MNPVVLNIGDPDMGFRLVMDYSTDFERYFVYEQAHDETYHLRVYSGYDQALRDLNERCKELHIEVI